MFNIKKNLPNRTNRPYYRIETRLLVSGPPTEGRIVAVSERVDHDRRIASYTVETPDEMTSVHPPVDGWFFKRVGAKWEFIGFGHSLGSLWPTEPRRYALP